MREKTDEDEEEFGIDWAERDGFQVKKMRVPQLWGPDSETPLFEVGVRPHPKVAIAGKSLVQGNGINVTAILAGMSRPRVRRIRKGLEASGVTIPKRTRGRSVDISGQRFGKLIAIKRVGYGRGSQQKSFMWFCKCDCGGTIVTNTHTLRRGGTKSCGCIQGWLRRKRKRSAYNKLYKTSHSKIISRKNREWRSLNIFHLRSYERNRNRQIREQRSEPYLTKRKAHRAWEKQSIKSLSDGYIKSIIRKTTGLPASEVTPILIQAKRAHLKLKRLLKESRYG